LTPSSVASPDGEGEQERADRVRPEHRHHRIADLAARFVSADD